MTANSPDQFVVLFLQPPILRVPTGIVSAQISSLHHFKWEAQRLRGCRVGGYGLLVPDHLGFNIVNLKGAVMYVLFASALGHEKRVVVSVVCTAVNVDETSDCHFLTIDWGQQQIRRDKVESPDIKLQRLHEVLAHKTEMS